MQAEPTLAGALPQRVALLGNPNCGKTALFNLLTGSRQKVANYAGVTVERKEGVALTPQGRQVFVLDLPGTYSLHAASADEAVTRDVVTGNSDEPLPDLLICVADATNLRLSLQLVLQARQLGLPMLLVLNLSDMLARSGIRIDHAALARELGMPVVYAVGVQTDGAREVLAALDQPLPAAPTASATAAGGAEGVLALQAEVRRLMDVTVQSHARKLELTDRLDRVVLHPLGGPLLLALILFLVFQAVFSWAAWPMDLIVAGTEALGSWVRDSLPEGALRSLLADGVIAGAGGVLVFLPQILFLFLFILALEDSGYLPRAAFLLDRLMGKVGLSGRSFIPLLSSFACAIPGIMATRSISDPRDRLTTIFVAPLMTCSARLPVYALLIAAFIPEKMVWGLFNLQGLVLFGLYMAGILSALAVSFVLKFFQKDKSQHMLLMELPSYRFPDVKSVWIGLLDRAKIFLKRVGGIIFALSILLWFLCTFPQPPEGATLPAIDYSFAGMLGHVMQPIFAPLGFNWQICIALIPAMAAREVVVAALGTVYALSAADDDAVAQGLSTLISSGDLGWSLATGLSLLVWFIYAPHCLATLATVKRETGSWKTVGFMTVYLFGLAYLMSFLTYQIASHYFG